MHRRLLKREQRHWYINDVGLPMFVSIIVIGIARLLIHTDLPSPIMFLCLSFVLTLTITSSALVSSEFRVWLIIKIRRWRSAYGS
jgi:hypothetical protein